MEASRPPAYFAALLAASLVAACHEVFVRQLDVYLGTDARALATAAVAASLAAAIATALATHRTLVDSRAALPWLLAALSLALTASAPAWFFGLSHGLWLKLVAFGVPVSVAALFGASVVAAFGCLARPLSALGALELLLQPFRLLGLALALGLAASAAAMIGPWRSAAAVGMSLGLAAAWCAPLFAYLDLVSFPRARASRVAGAVTFVLALAVFAAAELTVPVADLAFYDGDIVHTRQTERRRWVTTSAQGEFFLYADRTLETSTLDAHRYYETLVHPALSAAPRRERILLLGSGNGLAEREVLRHARVRELVVVVHDAAAAKLARELPFLAPRTLGALDDPRVTIVEQEPIVWLERAREVFDVAIVDLGDPSSYLEGKNYTRLFYSRLAERLASGGIGVVQATSSFATPKSFGTIEKTLRTAALATLPYHAPVPSLGVWSFVLFSRAEIEAPPAVLPANLRFLTPAGLAAAFAQPLDVAPPAGLEPNLLHAQGVVELLQDERSHP